MPSRVICPLLWRARLWQKSSSGPPSTQPQRIPKEPYFENRNADSPILTTKKPLSPLLLPSTSALKSSKAHSP